jgi:hypothetical protein
MESLWKVTSKHYFFLSNCQSQNFKKQLPSHFNFTNTFKGKVPKLQKAASVPFQFYQHFQRYWSQNFKKQLPSHFNFTNTFKGIGPKTSKSSFRPIPILPTLSKVFESVMHDRLLKHCLENNIITEKQAAYLKGDSTVSQLLYMVHNIRQNWGNKKVTQGLFLDVSSAFDNVWHNGLLAKLNQIGVEDTFLITISSYLAGRKQVDVVDGTH